MKVLVTAGTVYGRLDANKLVGNRVRGIWACGFAGYLSTFGHEITLLIPDTMPRFDKLNGMVGTHWKNRGPLCREGHGGRPGAIEVVRQTGYYDYRRKCNAMALTHDCAVMAAAVVNWIPAEPYEGKMPTEGYDEGAIIKVPFFLAPRVIQDMKRVNPKLTLIGCKMLVGVSEETLVDAAYDVLLKSRCNVVVGNDMGRGLRRKILVYKDRSVHEYVDDFDRFYEDLRAVIEDTYYSTSSTGLPETLAKNCPAAPTLFNSIVESNRSRFIPVEGGRVYGSVAINCGLEGWLVSPREKGKMFTAADAVAVVAIDWERNIVITQSGKATLNAPLLIRYALKYGHKAVVHFHEEIEGLPTLPYAPPGTVRDNNRNLPETGLGAGFNIKGHGCVQPILT